MTIGLTEEHEALRDAVRGWAARHVTCEELRAAVDADSEQLPWFWEKLAAQGLLGVHLADGGGTLVELAIVLEELARVLTPGPVLSTVLASAVLDRGATAQVRDALLPVLSDGTRTAAVGLAPGLTATRDADGIRVSGTTAPVSGGAVASVFVLSAVDGDDEVWFVAENLDTTPVTSLDLTARSARVTLDDVPVPAERIITRVDVRGLAATLAAAEACGVATWCLETASEYAKVRVQFGRPIGQFQAVKHRCAEMLLALEQARAATWDAARDSGATGLSGPARDSGATDLSGAARDSGALAASVAGVLGPDAAVRCAKDCIQILGGTGFTWEHDAHLYLRRALTLRAIVGPGDAWARQTAELTLAGARRDIAVQLPADAEAYRDEARRAAIALAPLDPPAQRAAMATDGWIVPHLPRPWGRGAGPLEQLVIQQQFAAAGVRVPDLVIGAWVVPTLVRYGDAEQQERFLPPTLRGELTWCQLFSEPGAGSDLAALATKASRADGGWRLTGQKIWTSVAHAADWGICLARTDPDVAKHRGISYFLVDMRTLGIDVRPLRELTGRAMFNEVFLDDVFVPDSCLVGAPGDGWRLARTTLANERVALSSGWASGAGVTELAALVSEPTAGFGRLVCAEQAFALLGLRATLRRLSGLEPGPTSSARKLLGIRHAQLLAEHGWSLLGPAGAMVEGEAALWPGLMLGTRAMSIAGGTTEVQLNILAERILGLPRDP